MRFTTVARLFALSLVSSALALPPLDVAGRAEAPELAARADKDGGKSPVNDAGSKVTAGGAETGTTFNGQSVPALLEINGAKIDETIGKGYWYERVQDRKTRDMGS